MTASERLCSAACDEPLRVPQDAGPVRNPAGPPNKRVQRASLRSPLTPRTLGGRSGSFLSGPRRVAVGCGEGAPPSCAT